MRAIFKKDFRFYFTSPIGYVFLTLFFFVVNLLFYLFNIVNRSADLSLAFIVILIALTLTLPILTMRLMSEEYRQKTDQLLLTAPIKPSAIILGKFFSAFGFVVTALVVTLIFPLTVALYGATNGAAIAGNYVAILCVSAACLSIGLFLSTLTENQIISALGTWGAFLLLLGLYFLLPATTPFLGALVGWVSIFSRFDSFTQGIFPLDDIVYYVSLCAVFLFLSVRTLEKKRWA